MSYSQAQGAAVCRSRFGMRGSDAQVIGAFQKAYNLGAWLSLDTKCGSLTSAAIAKSASLGRPSAHFTWREFTCTCGGKYPECRRVIINRDLLRRLEAYRNSAGAVSVRSGYRCPRRNTKVGGAPSSRHVVGDAADINGRFTLSQIAKYGFNGKGVQGSTGLVIHVDVRPTAVRPWRYAV